MESLVDGRRENSEFVMLWTGELFVCDDTVLVSVLMLEDVFNQLIMIGNIVDFHAFRNLFLQVFTELFARQLLVIVGVNLFEDIGRRRTIVDPNTFHLKGES